MVKVSAWLWAIIFVFLLLKLISRTADSRSVVPEFIFCDRYKYLYSCESDPRALPLRFCPVLTRCCIGERTMVQEERSRD